MNYEAGDPLDFWAIVIAMILSLVAGQCLMYLSAKWRKRHESDLAFHEAGEQSTAVTEESRKVRVGLQQIANAEKPFDAFVSAIRNGNGNGRH